MSKYPAEWSEESRKALDDLFVRAKAEKLWFFYGGLNGPLWFSPAELEQQQKKGKFLWGAPNWRLHDPQEYVKQLTEQINALDRQRDSVCIRIEESKKK